MKECPSNQASHRGFASEARDERPLRAVGSASRSAAPPPDHQRTREPRVPTIPSSKHRPALQLAVGAAIALVLSVTATHATSPFDLLPLNPASPNYEKVFDNVRIGQTEPETNGGRAGSEILNAVYAYLAPDSPVAGDTGYRDRLLVLLDYYLGNWAEGQGLGDIGMCWESSTPSPC